MSNADPSRKTIDTLDRPSTIPHIGVEKSDAYVLSGGFALGMLVTFQFNLGLFGIPVVLLGGVLAGAVLFAKPSTLTATQYVRVVGRHLITRGEVTAGDDGSASLRDQLVTTRSTRERTHVKRYLPGRGAIERDDGRFVGCLKVEPQKMDFAESADWEYLTSILTKFANDTLDFPMQVYATTRAFPIDDHVADLEARLDDPDVEGTPLEKVIEDVAHTRQEDLEEANTSPLHFYVIVEVAQSDVMDDAVGESTGLSKLAQLPVLGDVFTTVATSRDTISDEEFDRRMLDELDRRLGAVAGSYVNNVEDAEAYRVPLSEWLPVLEEYWYGERRAERDPEMIRNSPVVTAPEPGHNPVAAEAVSSLAPDDQSVFGSDGSDTDAQASGDDVDSEEETVDEDAPADESAGDVDESEAVDDLVDEFPELREIQQRQLAPDGINAEFDRVTVGDSYCQVMYVEGWPDQIAHGALRRVISRPDIEYDLSIHLDPMDQNKAKRDAEKRYRAQKGDAEIDADELSAGDKLSDAAETKLVREQIKNGQAPFRVSVYIVARADDEATLDEFSRELRTTFSDRPANMTLKTVKGEQATALEAASPIGVDQLAKRGELDPTEIVLGQGVGALLASIQDSGLLEDGGIEFGQHARNNRPLIKDPFATGSNYNWTVLGDSGAGKTYSSGLLALRTRAMSPDTKLIFIDPMQNFEGLARALDATSIRVSGQRSLNPMEIRPPAETATDTDVDPLSQKIKDVLSLFDNYAAQQGLEQGLGKARPLLSAAIKETYKRAGITHNVDTHSKESPCIRDLLDVLEDMAENPAEYILRSEKETDELSNYATNLIHFLRPFVDGEYENLADRSSFELGDEDVIYMDMSDQEGQMDGGGGLMMQLVFSEVYERAKETTDNVVIIIDEARFFMRHSTNLDFLGQRVRHSRHFDTSIRFVTQNIQDFMGHEEANSIINNSAVTMFHRLEEIGEWTDEFDLNHRETQFIHEAATGENGYSESLLDINGERYPLRITATPTEDAVVDYDVREDDPEDLPSAGDQSPPESVAEIRSMINDRARGHRDWLVDADDRLIDAWNSLSDEYRRYVGLLTDRELKQLLVDVAREPADPDDLLAMVVGEKIEALISPDARAVVEAQIRSGSGPSAGAGDSTERYRVEAAESNGDGSHDQSAAADSGVGMPAVDGADQDGAVAMGPATNGHRNGAGDGDESGSDGTPSDGSGSDGNTGESGGDSSTNGVDPDAHSGEGDQSTGEDQSVVDDVADDRSDDAADDRDDNAADDSGDDDATSEEGAPSGDGADRQDGPSEAVAESEQEDDEQAVTAPVDDHEIEVPVGGDVAEPMASDDTQEVGAEGDGEAVESETSMGFKPSSVSVPGTDGSSASASDTSGESVSGAPGDEAARDDAFGSVADVDESVTADDFDGDGSAPVEHLGHDDDPSPADAADRSDRDVGEADSPGDDESDGDEVVVDENAAEQSGPADDRDSQQASDAADQADDLEDSISRFGVEDEEADSSENSSAPSTDEEAGDDAGDGTDGPDNTAESSDDSTDEARTSLDQFFTGSGADEPSSDGSEPIENGSDDESESATSDDGESDDEENDDVYGGVPDAPATDDSGHSDSETKNSDGDGLTPAPAVPDDSDPILDKHYLTEAELDQHIEAIVRSQAEASDGSGPATGAEADSPTTATPADSASSEMED